MVFIQWPTAAGRMQTTSTDGQYLAYCGTFQQKTAFMDPSKRPPPVMLKTTPLTMIIIKGQIYVEYDMFVYYIIDFLLLYEPTTGWSQTYTLRRHDLDLSFSPGQGGEGSGRGEAARLK